MIRVNLLPPELLIERERRRKRGRAILAGALVVVLLAGIWGFLFTSTLWARARVVAFQQERAMVEAEIAAYTPYTQLQAEVTADSTRIKKAMGTVPDWVQVLSSLGRVIPGDVWLTDCTASYAAGKAGGTPPGQTPQGQAPPGQASRQSPEGQVPGQTPVGQASPGPVSAAQAAPGQVALRGLTYDQRSTAHWLAKLYEVPEFTGVRCVFSGIENYQGAELIRFEVKAVLRPGPQYDPLQGKMR